MVFSDHAMIIYFQHLSVDNFFYYEFNHSLLPQIEVMTGLPSPDSPVLSVAGRSIQKVKEYCECVIIIIEMSSRAPLVHL